VPVKGLSLHHESHVGKLSLVQHAVDTGPQSAFLLGLKVGFLDSAREVGTWVGIENIHILQVILPVTPPNNVQFTINERHGMSSARVWIRIIFCVKDIVAMLPRRRFRIKCIQIIETVCMRSTTSEKVKLIADIAKLHAGSRCWTFADYFDLRPSEG